jgi:cell division protein FtsN
MTFYSTLTTREGDPEVPPAAAEPQAPERATVPNQTDEREAVLPGRSVPEQDAQGQVSAQSETGQPKRTAEPPVATASRVPIVALSASPPPDASFYSVQVGSFRRANDAQRLQQRLAQKGYAARLLSITLPGNGLWHRVRVGTFSDRVEADRMAQRLRSQENMTVLVTSE